MKNTKLITTISALLFSASTVALAQSPYLQPDDTWISLSGTVESVEPDSFVLNYGRGSVTVEMDDGDRDADAYALLEGDDVVVNGLIDDDFFELTTIEASSVYVESINTYFYASATDEESLVYNPIISVAVPVVPGDLTLQGTITAIDHLEEEIVINTGLSLVTVELDDLGYNPLDEDGYIKLDLQDQVTVSGTISNDFFEGRIFEADYIISVDS